MIAELRGMTFKNKLGVQYNRKSMLMAEYSYVYVCVCALMGRKWGLGEDVSECSCAFVVGSLEV